MRVMQLVLEATRVVEKVEVDAMDVAAVRIAQTPLADDGADDDACSMTFPAWQQVFVVTKWIDHPPNAFNPG